MKKLILLLGVLTPLFLVAQNKPDSVDTLGTVVCFYPEVTQFVGGQDSLMSFIRKNAKYPEKAKAEKKSGNVYVSFIVDTTGEVTDVKIKRGVSPELDEEAIRVVKLMPKWKPAHQEGKLVKQQFSFPIRFILRD